MWNFQKKFWSFLQSKSVNNVCKLLPLLRDFVPRPLPGLCPWTSLVGLRPQTRWAIAPQVNVPGCGTGWAWWTFSCSDYISVHDGTDATTRRLQQFCESAYNQTVTSSGDRLYVQFVSDDRFEAQGFAASFRFIPRDRLTTSVAVTTPSYTSGKRTLLWLSGAALFTATLAQGRLG